MNKIREEDIRIFYDKDSKSYVIANDYKYRKLRDRGYSRKYSKDNSHAHLKNKKAAERVKDNILENKMEKNRNKRVLKAYIRITDNDYKHYDKIEEILASKIRKGKQKYININKGAKGVW